MPKKDLATLLLKAIIEEEKVGNSMIAEVIVDVSAYPIDRPFDYIVPEAMESIIEPGARVKVPFGPRKVIGYITGLKDESDLGIDKLKPIDELDRFEPVISSELLELI